MLFPLRVEDAEVDRVPWISIAIAVACAAAFAVTWLVPAHPQGVSPEQLIEVLAYYEQHPYLDLPDKFSDDFVPTGMRKELKDMHQPVPHGLDADSLSLEQRHLESLVEEANAQAQTSLLRRFSLVPSRGALQPGWLTHMFLHFGWMHILGNLFFFYLVGPLLEDLWGRTFFPAFYVVGGLIAGLAHFSLDVHSSVMMAGASGAIAACMGAFTWRCAQRKIRMFYMLGILRSGTFLIPAWLWGFFWFGNEVLTFYLNRGANSGVAVMAHIGGFGFGFASALFMERSGFEARHLAPAVQKKVMVFEQHEGNDRAREALERGDKVAAAVAYDEVLMDRPDDREAIVGLAKIDGDLTRIEKILLGHLSKNDPPAAWALVQELGRAFDPAKVSSRCAWQLAGTAFVAPEALRHLPDALDETVAKAGGPLGAKAIVRSAKRALARGDQEAARRQVAAGKSLPGVAREIVAQLEQIEAQLGSAADADQPTVAGTPMPRHPPAVSPPVQRRASETAGPKGLAVKAGPSPAKPAPAPARPAAAPARPAPAVAAKPAAPAATNGAVRVLTCRLVSLDDDAMHVEPKGGQVRRIEWTKVVGVGAGIVTSEQGTSILTDFILSWGQEGAGPIAVRIPGAHLMPLADLYPGVSAREAYAKLLADILARTSADAVPDAVAIAAGRYPKYATISALNAAFYSARQT